MKINIISYDTASGKGFYIANGKTLQFRYTAFGKNKWFIGKGIEKNGLFFKEKTKWQRFKEFIRRDK